MLFLLSLRPFGLVKGQFSKKTNKKTEIIKSVNPL